MNKARIIVCVGVFCAPLVFLGCQDSGTSTGEAMISVLNQALSTDIQKVRVKIYGPGIPTTLSGELQKADTKWSGIISDIPAGEGRTVAVDAYDSDNQVIYTGKAENVTVTSGAQVKVLVVLQPVNPLDQDENYYPYITAFSASSDTTAPQGLIAFSITIDHQLVNNETLSIDWSATAGSFDKTHNTSCTWTAPAEEGQQTISVKVTDSKGAFQGMSMNVQVKLDPTSAKGDAEVEVVINNWPLVAALTIDPGYLFPGQSNQLAVTASDLDGDPLSYQWSCKEGTFDDATKTNPQFTASSDLKINTTVDISVTVDDGRGGAVTYTLRQVPVGQASTSIDPTLLCGNGVCDSGIGETSTSCPQDCQG